MHGTQRAFDRDHRARLNDLINALGNQKTKACAMMRVLHQIYRIVPSPLFRRSAFINRGPKLNQARHIDLMGQMPE